MALLARTAEAAQADDLIDRLARHDIRYVTGGSTDPSRAVHAGEEPSGDEEAVVRLIADLTDAPAVRLTDALVALLLRHPEYVSHAHRVLAGLPQRDTRAQVLLARLLAAAALQRVWWFVLRLYLGSQAAIDVEDLCATLGLPDPEQEHGERLLAATARWLDPTQTIDWANSWEDAAEQLLSDLRLAHERRE